MQEKNVALKPDGLTDGEIFLRLERESPADEARGWVPALHFSICRVDTGEVAGEVDLRMGHNQNTYYGGNIGYAVLEKHRGHHFAARSVMLLSAFAKSAGMEYLIITCEPDNLASRRTCSFAGARLMEIVKLPPDNDMYLEGAREECIYRLEL